MNSIDHVASDPLEACPSDALISRDLHCIGCGYNLRTMRFDGRCPECGLAVERSVLVLPQPRATGEAILLAAFALAVGFVGLYVSPFKIVAVAMLLLAVYRLRYRCKLSHVSELGPKVRWLWNTVLISAIVLAVSVANRWAQGDYRLMQSTPGSSMSVSMRQTAGRKVMTLDFSEVSGSFDVTTDAQGHRQITLFDESTTPIGKRTLAPGQSTSIKDAAGKNVRLSLDAAGVLTIQVRASTKVLMYPNGSTALVTMPPGPLKIVLTSVLAVVGLTATILYLLVCRALAIRSNNPRLARRFRIIFWVIVSAFAVMVVILGGAILGANIGGIPRMVPLLAAVLCLLVAGVSQIVASIQLSSALRRVPQHWSEVVAGPEGEGEN